MLMLLNSASLTSRLRLSGLARYTQQKSDATFLQQREKIIGNAIEKWRFVISIDSSYSEVGRQLSQADAAEADVVLTSVMGVKPPNTILKRVNAILMYYRWHAVHGAHSFLPFNEDDVWHYVLWQKTSAAPATRSHSFLQSLRFSHFMMGCDGAIECVNSGRINGQAQLQLSHRNPMKQASPLTVAEVKKLHSIADGSAHSKVDKCIASNLLLALYGRCRVSDLNIHEILHDVSDANGFLEVSTRFHKSAKTS